MRHHVLVVALVMFLVSGRAERASAEERVERNVVFGMYSGLALLMDVYYPENPNGYGIVFISGSGWTPRTQLGRDPAQGKRTRGPLRGTAAAAGFDRPAFKKLLEYCRVHKRDVHQLN